jgi:Rod binding domain-containing protein
MIEGMTGPAGPTPAPGGTRDDRLRAAAVGLEAGFLAEMLRSAGFGQARTAFGGGAGEDHFTNFLVRQQAEEMARRGGIGIAEALFEALKARDSHA